MIWVFIVLIMLHYLSVLVRLISYFVNVPEVTLHRQENKKWSPRASDREIRNAMRQKLVDVHSKLKKKFQLVEQ